MGSCERQAVKSNGLIRPDAIGLPYGDIAHDDYACSRFINTRATMYELGKSQRRLCKGGRMSRRKFEKWMKEGLELDDDKPLRDILPTEL